MRFRMLRPIALMALAVLSEPTRLHATGEVCETDKACYILAGETINTPLDLGVSGIIWFQPEGQALIPPLRVEQQGIQPIHSGAPVTFRFNAGARLNAMYSIRPGGRCVSGGCSRGSVYLYDACTGARLQMLFGAGSGGGMANSENCVEGMVDAGDGMASGLCVYVAYGQGNASHDACQVMNFQVPTLLCDDCHEPSKHTATFVMP